MQWLLNFTIKRFAYPEWCTLVEDADEEELDYRHYRDEIMTMFINLTMIKPFYSFLITQLYENLRL
jgi:hypothetical protein